MTPDTRDPRPVLVTGGAGFLGSHLCERLLREGHRVLAVDNLSSGRVDNLRHLLVHSGFELRQQDATVLQGVHACAVFNLACPASPPFYQRDPIGTTLTCVLGTLRALDIAHGQRVPLLQASTSEIYGDPDVHPQPETYRGNVSTTGPRACYDEGKRCAETLCYDYARQHGVSIRVARIFNTYGPRMLPDDGRVVSNFIVQALRGEDITLYGDGQQSRSFCFVEDTIDGLLRLMASGVEQPVNLGNPHEVTMLELAERVLRLTASRSRLVHHPLPADDPRRRCPDIRLARTQLDWAPRVPLDEGLARTVAHLRAVTGASAPRGPAARARRLPSRGVTP
ncbi:MAG: NAD-dependent epimerase/dehydratase family protein [Hydrogenophaga sp.]|uniref:UDP-glucuronic acid decarboxylase family protein n=1 Tax=Hydrogenophaga sp. TaxID=1904254 RepID=UPI00169DCD9F|nr:UDP-glucuronic acid decarboxylase family protein [Hydrogenophaga sp.]NIM41109.1 NAD-dependent epimerase/dehydratase family protein [Hydrogenophaga sp.]NIN26425.1 NAD-dependent epimerase/dehydratase family protein [Hydrogenophaga sp.]NIN31300.1 NAD-dependent epimerase/dehydratase family protein [Hydrogenophaga sp.]NIN55355.1 NAD-dependent epimerase/dehydratase family protein [Hydrogenophaga sp.]NIO51690.1 NAD-dependent epimerase/dehydratase family protein [Hydrogenophaga sp.]